MGTHLTFQYDREADILYINTCTPYPEQESEELEDEVVARFNPETNEIENLEVLFFLRDYYVRTFLNYRFRLNCGGNQQMGQSKIKLYRKIGRDMMDEMQRYILTMVN